MLKVTHRIESIAGHFVRTVRQDNEGMHRWEIADESGKVIASSNDEQFALIEAKRQLYKLDITRLEYELDSDPRIATLLEILNEELDELTGQALALRNAR